MKILAIDTVFNKCSLALMVDNQIIYAEEQTGKHKQTEQILPMIDKALQTTNLSLADLSALVFNRGPGAFSGIRINTAVVQALSVACDIPCVGISSLQLLAQTAFEAVCARKDLLPNTDVNNEEDLFSLSSNNPPKSPFEKGGLIYSFLDARMQQVYIGEFCLNDEGIMQAVADDNETLLDYGKHTAKPLPIFGLSSDNQDLLAIADNQDYQQVSEPKASVLAKLGAYQFQQQGGVSAEHALPVYLRNNAWKTLKEQGKK